MPERRGDLSVVHFDAERGANWEWWLEHDGFGGQVGSVNVPSEYLIYLDGPKGVRCVYILNNTFARRDSYYTKIRRDYVLFRKSDLVRVIESALSSEEKTAAENIHGKRVIDNVIWDDSIPSGPGLEVTDVEINLQVNLAGEKPDYKIAFR